MKRINLILLLLAIMSVKLTAQVNPQKGYIITNNNDTIHGTIDYLTDAQNAKSCLFQKAGESDYKSLTPADIRGYRLADDGIYYVTRLFTGGEEEDQQQELLFAEFLLQGGVSLYRYYYDYYNYFGFVGSDGKEVIMRDDKLNEDLQTYNHKLQVRRQKVQEVNAIMNKDNNIANRLWKMDLTSEDLTRMVKQYDEQHCTEQGECVLFRYDKKKTATVKHKFYAGVGISFASYDSPSHDITSSNSTIFSEYSYSGIAPTFFVGTDLRFPRFSRNLQAQVELSYTPHRYKSDKVSSNGEHPEMTINEVAARIGLNYIFSPDRRIRPFIKGGLLLSWNMNMNEKNLDFKYKKDYESPVSYGNGKLDYGIGTKAGIYLGAGVDISHIRISALWRKALGGKDGFKEKNCGILAIAYIF